MLLLEALFNLAKAGMPIIILILAWIYLQVILARDKRTRKEMRQYNSNIKKEERRRVQEEKLKTIRIKHPKVFYLDDYRPLSRQIPNKII